MKSQSPDSPPAAAFASASAAGTSPIHTNSSLSAVDDYSALITPTKAVGEGQQQQHHPPFKKEKKRQHTQLQLAVEKVGGASSKVVLKNKHKKKKSSASNEPPPSSVPQSIKWPPVSSTKSLPPLVGRFPDLLKAEQSSSLRGKKEVSQDTIEFEVNQECECMQFP